MAGGACVGIGAAAGTMGIGGGAGGAGGTGMVGKNNPFPVGDIYWADTGDERIEIQGIINAIAILFDHA